MSYSHARRIVYKKTQNQDGNKQPKMNSPNTHRKPVLLYCSRPTQTQEDSETESELSDFPPCKIGNSAPLISRSWTPPSHSRYLQGAMSGSESQQQPTTQSSEKGTHSKPRRGLGQTNMVNTLSWHTKVYFSLILACKNING